MTYKDAEKLQSLYAQRIVGNPSILEIIPSLIKGLVIAEEANVVEVYNELITTPQEVNNKTILEKMGIINNDLTVYIVWLQNKVPFWMNLTDYLEALEESGNPL